MKHFISFFVAIVLLNPVFSQTISSTTYPFTTNTGVAIEDMSSGTTLLIGPSTDFPNGILHNIGFEYRYAGTSYTQYAVSDNGYIRLGGNIVSPGLPDDYNNSITSSLEAPCIAPYWDNIKPSASGKVHTKTIGAALNRKLVIEWLNMEIPLQTASNFGSFQLWLSETTGRIDFVYGNTNLQVNNNFYSLGILQSNGIYASINPTTHVAAYGNGINPNANTPAIEAGRQYSFIPNTANAPTNLSFTAVGGTTMTLNWLDNATNETGYAIYSSINGGSSWTFVEQKPANATSTIQTFLLPGTTYTWRIVALTNGAQSAPLDASQATLSNADINSNGSGGGDWNNAATWAGGQIPNDASNATIAAGDVVTINTGAQCYNLQVSGTLVFENTVSRSLDVMNNAIINNGGIIKTSGTGIITTHQLRIRTNLTNDGTLDFFDGTTAATLVFNGPGNSVYNGNGPTNDINVLKSAKSIITDEVLLQVSNFSVKGITNNGSAGFWDPAAGTLKIGGSNTFSIPLTVSANGVINSSSGFWLDNANANLLGQAGLLSVLGRLRVSNGILNVGTVINNDLIGSGTLPSSFTLEGGIINVAGKCSTINIIYMQSGGVLNVCTVGNSISGQASFRFKDGSFTMSGGEIRIIKQSTAASSRDDYYCYPTTTNIIGGKVVFGVNNVTVAAGISAFFRVTGFMPSVEMANQIPNLRLNLVNGDAEIFGDLTIPLNGTISTSTVGLVCDGNVINNGVISVTGSTSNDFTFKGNGAPSMYSGTGLAGTASSPLSDLVIDNPAGLIIQNNITNNLVVSRIEMYNGNITNSNKITIGNNSTLATITIGSNSTKVNPGFFDVPPTFNHGAGGLTLEYKGTQTITPLYRTMGFELPPNRTVTNLYINPSQIGTLGEINAGSGNLYVTSTLNFQSGRLKLNGDTLIHGTAAVTSILTYGGYTNSSIYNGKYSRRISTSTSTTWLLPVGNATNTQLAQIMFTTAPPASGYITAEWIPGSPGNSGLPLTEGAITVNSVNDIGYWRFGADAGFQTAAYTISLYPYNGGSFADITKLVALMRTNSVSPWMLTGTHVTTSGSAAQPMLSRTGIIGFGNFGVGMPGISTPATSSWTGATDTNWLNAGNWSNGVPGAITDVTIPTGMPRYPTINSNTSVKSLTIERAAAVSLANGVNMIISGN